MSSDKKHPDKPLEDLRKAHEEEFFRKQNLENIKKMKNQKDMAGSGIKDPELAEKLSQAGFNGDSVRALFIIPLIEVAWVDWTIQPEERATIMGLMEKRGIEKDSAAHKLVIKWLAEKPEDAAYKQGWDLIKPIVDEASKLDTETIDWVLEACSKVAESTGGLFGTGIGSKISKHEAEVIKSVTAKLKNKA